jgi:hypothetical protein
MRLMVLSVMGIIVGLGLVAAIVSVPVMAEKGPLRTTLVTHLGGGQEKQVPGGGDPDGEGRAVVKVFREQLCGRVETSAIESSSSKATIKLGMSGEKGPTVANLEERAATTPLAESTTPTTTTTTTGTTGTTTGTTTPTTGTTTSTTGATGAQQTATTTTTTGDSTSSPQATTTAQSTTGAQTSLSQSTASPTASASASASASTSTSSTSRATIHEHTGGCVEVPRALSLALLEHPARFYVNVTNEQYPEGAIRGQLHKSGAGEHHSGDVHHRSGNDDD